jgi:hypothetical protein
MTTPLQPRPPKELRRWTVEEEHQLIFLHDTQHKKFTEIAPILNRTPNAINQRYTTIKQRQYSSAIDWTPQLDQFIIEGRRRILSTKDIAAEVKIPVEAVAGRWNTLQREKKVPEDVLALLSTKEDVVFTREEDEMILKLWMQGNDDGQIIQQVMFKGKSEQDVKARRIELSYGSPLYLELLGVGKGEENETDALKMAVGKPKYGWMK